MSLCVWCVEPVLWGEGKLESPKLEFRRRASNLSGLFQRFFLFYFCLFISGPPLFVAFFFSFRFCDSPPLSRSLIFSGFIAREYQPFETASKPLLPETAPEEEGDEQLLKTVLFVRWK